MEKKGAGERKKEILLHVYINGSERNVYRLITITYFSFI